MRLKAFVTHQTHIANVSDAVQDLSVDHEGPSDTIGQGHGLPP